MKQIVINPKYPSSREPHPDDLKYPELAFLIDERHAISTDGYYICLVQVAPDEKDPGSYKMSGEEYFQIGIDDARTVQGLAKIVEQLKVMSAYELLTKHYRNTYLGPTFYVNRDNTYLPSYEEDDLALPVNEINPPTGGDY